MPVSKNIMLMIRLRTQRTISLIPLAVMRSTSEMELTIDCEDRQSVLSIRKRLELRRSIVNEVEDVVMVVEDVAAVVVEVDEEGEEEDRGDRMIDGKRVAIRAIGVVRLKLRRKREMYGEEWSCMGVFVA